MKTKKLLKVGAVSAALAAGMSLVNQQSICLPCMFKKGLAAVKINADSTGSYDNGMALTPPMGWSSWNLFRHRINEDLIYDIAKAMKDSGLADAGYTYVNLDDCWQSSMRDKDGKMEGDHSRFPSGIKALVDKVNELGLKLGIYSSNGTFTCEDLPASLGNEAIDADTFAEWGIEYLKYDYCHNKTIPTMAPDIDKISISLPGSSAETVYQAEDAQLFGTARIVSDPKLETGKFVSGLHGGNGKLYFPNVEVDEAGEYVLTIGIRKVGPYNKYLEVKVNNGDVYSLDVPSTLGFTHEGRLQLIVKLEKGVNTIMLANPVGSRFDSAIKQYTKMGKELKRATAEYAAKSGQPEKKMVYSICEWGANMPFKWGASAGNLWRTTPDIKAFWLSVLGIYEINVRLWKHSHPGAWNDPDMLEVGN
ncbi:MAG: alpha-galactosidase, partial [Clostridia bacterium]|nr:alpha-galactosidase [Clostridia bacterium]